VEDRSDRAGGYDAQKEAAWSAFYGRSPKECAIYMSKALQFLVELAEAQAAAATQEAAAAETAGMIQGTAI
ncbi:MAG: hypothetical protein AAGF98_14870, partial [Cyanobacteria bacterium P01_H01_bin.153]